MAVLATAVIYTLPMAAWMLLRGMDVRATTEMAAATLAVGVVLVGYAARAQCRLLTAAPGPVRPSVARPVR